MKLNIIVDGRANTFTVPDNLMHEAQDFFDKINADMDQGWQMSRDWVQHPTPAQRCQIAGDRILTYVIKTMPGIKGFHIDTTGDMNETELVMEIEGNRPLGPIFN